MSADNWAECPKCKRDRETKLAKLDADIASQYGKVTVEAFDELRRRATEERTAKINLHTFREDYEIGVYDGEFYISYTGGCSVCGITHSFKHEAKLDLA
ncbi:hypothetical protein [Rhodococcus sp. NPDC006774]|uniref:hypothetical protein n=1 Tax=Rhodococcus sp. NPDC006774 TaxID=3157186 RepID=UPI0034010FD9